MMPLDEKDLQLLAEVLPNVSAQLRSSMANVFAAANRLAPAEAREADPMLDKNAAILTMSCHQMLRLVGNLSAVSELVQGGRFRLCNDDIVGFCHALCERAEEMQICSAYTWQKLSPEDREIILECARESALYEREVWTQREEQSRSIAIENGTKVVELSAEEKKRFQNAVYGVYEKYCGDDMGLIEEILKEGS